MYSCRSKKNLGFVYQDYLFIYKYENMSVFFTNIRIIYDFYFMFVFFWNSILFIIYVLHK